MGVRVEFLNYLGQLSRTLNNKVKEQILKGREFEEDKQLETNKRFVVYFIKI